MTRSRDICVLGGSGAMGRVVVKCLLKAGGRAKITVADRRKPDGHLPSRVSYAEVDLLKHAGLVRLLQRHRVVINSTSHHFNLPVMRAALEAGTAYLDLGGLFHYTRKQLKLDAKFRTKGLLAILGMGCAPGVANLMAVWAAEGMDRVEEIHIKVGGKSWDPPSSAVPYAVGTIREELTWKPAIVAGGKWGFAEPMSGKEHFNFSKPVGRQKIFRTIHSEVATLPLSFPRLRACSFKIGFSNEMIQAVLHPPRRQAATRVAGMHPQKGQSGPRDVETTAAVVVGRVNGRKVTRVARYLSKSSAGHAAGDWNTAWPPALVSLMILKGKVAGSGVFPPEKIVPVHDLMDILKKQGFGFSVRSL